MNRNHKLLGALHDYVTGKPEGSALARTLGPAECTAIADSLDLRGWQVEAFALRQGVNVERYRRNGSTIGQTDQAVLLESRVAQVGLGGLGGLLLETLARAGVGHICAADGDRFEASNLNRQSLCTGNTLDKSKADAALLRCAEVNPSVELDALPLFVDAQSMPRFLAGAQVAVDALGGLDLRLDFQRAAADAGIPLVTGAVAGWTGYVAVVLPCAHGPADFMGTGNAAEERLGCPAPAVNTISSLMAREVLRLLLTGTSPLAGKMLLCDLDTPSFETVAL